MSEYRIDVDARLKNGSQTDVQKQLDSIMKNITADTTLAIDFAKSKVEIQQQTANIAKYIQTEFNKVAKSLKLPEMTDKNALKIANGYVKESVQAMKQQVKEQEKLNALQAKEDKKKQIQQEKELVTLRKEQFEYEQKRQQYKAEGAKQTEEVKNQQALMDAYKQAEEYTLREKEYLSQRNALIAEGVKQEKEYSAEVAKASTIDQKIANGQVSKDVGSITSKYNGLNTTTTATVIPESLKTDYQSLIALSEKLNTSLSDKEKNATWLQYQNTLASVKNQLSVVSTTTKQLATEQSRLSQAGEMTKWLQNNSKATKQFGNEINTMVAKLRSVDDLTVPELEKIRAEFQKIQISAREANKIGFSFGDKFKNGLSKFSMWFGTTAIFMRSIRAIKEMWNGVVELDTALVDLQKTTNMTESQLEKFYSNANTIAKQMGVTTTEIINQASAWSRLGYSTAETSEQMAKLSSQFSAISPDMDVDAATNGLVSIMKAFDVDPDNVLDGIMSKVNSIGNTAATSNGEVVNMLSKSSSAMKEANNTLEETIALETAAVEITRDDDSVGTAFKTIAMRLRGYDEETEGYTNDVEQLSGKIANLTKTASTPGGISLFTDDTKTTYKSTYELLKEISEIYDQLSDKDQAGLLEAIAGKRQGQIIAATINNFDAATKAMDTMANSAGSADAEMGIIMNSLEYKINHLKETGTGIAQNLFQKEDMKTAVDSFTKIGEAIEFVTDKLGLFGSIGLGAGLFAGIKNVGRDNRYLVTYAYPC